MKRKCLSDEDEQQCETKKTFLKPLSSFPQRDNFSYQNKNRGTLRIADSCLKAFFAEFAIVAKTPMHFYVVTKSKDDDTAIQSKFKLIPDSFIRMVACFLIHHR